MVHTVKTLSHYILVKSTLEVILFLSGAPIERWVWDEEHWMFRVDSSRVLFEDFFQYPETTPMKTALSCPLPTIVRVRPFIIY